MCWRKQSQHEHSEYYLAQRAPLNGWRHISGFLSTASHSANLFTQDGSENHDDSSEYRDDAGTVTASTIFKDLCVAMGTRLQALEQVGQISTPGKKAPAHLKQLVMCITYTGDGWGMDASFLVRSTTTMGCRT